MWQKSSFSNPSGNSVEVDENAEGQIIIRESEDIRQLPGVTTTSREQFAAFIKGVKAGEFDHFVAEREHAEV